MPLADAPRFQINWLAVFLTTIAMVVLCASGCYAGIPGVLTASWMMTMAATMFGFIRTHDNGLRLALLGLVLILWLIALWPNSEQPICVINHPKCPTNLSNLVLALLNYETAHRCFPPAYTTDTAGNRLHSWRTLILPYLGQLDVYNRIRQNEPWNSPTNRRVTESYLDFYHCPEDKSAGPYNTSYVAVIAPNSAWGIGKGISLGAIKDGPSNTILLVEMKNSGIKWSEPRDLDLDHLPPGINKAGLLKAISTHPGGIFVAFADGAVRFLHNTTSFDDFESLIT